MKLIHKLVVLIALAIGSMGVADWYVGYDQLETHWYGISIDGAKSGWSEESVGTNAENIRTQKIQDMTLSRGGMEISIKVSSAFIESKDGKPISVVTTQEAMGQVQESKWIFKDGMIEMTTVAGGDPIVKKVPMPKNPWLTPQAVRKLFKEKIKEGASVITYQTMVPEMGPSVVTVVMTKLGEEKKIVLGKEILVTAWETVNDKMPITGTEFYTNDGLSVVSSLNTSFGAITNTLMRRDEAMAPSVEVPELMVSLFVEPSKKIDNSAKKLTMKIKSKDGEKTVLPSIGFQHATSNEDGSATLVIDLSNPIEATNEERTDVNYRIPTAICDGSDPVVASIAKDVLGSIPTTSSDSLKAAMLRSKVHEYIDGKNLSTAFGSASQTARTREGDCTEHAVLLCGLLRASDIPSRGVMGMVYLPTNIKPNGIFGWHMWSQALIDGKWIDLDATLVEPFTVGHVATTTTSLSDDGMSAEMMGIMATIGNLEIEVIEEN